MNDPAPEPNVFARDMLLGAPPVPLPPKGASDPAVFDAVWSEMELRATLMTVHRVLALGHSIERIAQDNGRTVEKIQAAFWHLSDALIRATANPAEPYTPPPAHL